MKQLRQFCKKCGHAFDAANTGYKRGRDRLDGKPATEIRYCRYCAGRTQKPLAPPVPQFFVRQPPVVDHTKCDPDNLDKCPDGGCLGVWREVVAEYQTHLELSA